MVAIVMLSHKSSDLLESTLLSYKKQGFLSLIKERVIFIYNFDQHKKKIAESYGFKVINSADYSEKHITPNKAWELMMKEVSSKYVLMLEDDYPLIETEEEIRKQLSTSLYLLQHNKVNFVRLIHRKQPGKDFHLAKRYKEFYPYHVGESDFIKFIKRKIQPNDSQKLIGASVYVHSQPEKVHPHEVIKYNDHCFITSSKYIEWCNHSIFINKDWMLRIISKAKNSFFSSRNPEKFLSGEWWRKQNFPIAVCTGLFTHQ